MNCPACGGVVGRDCFNPQECMEITQAQAAAYRDQGERRISLDELPGYIKELESRIERMNEILGKVRMTCEMPPELYAEIDAVMTREMRT